MQEQEQFRETEQDGVTLREIFRTVWLRKWVAIAVAAGIFLVGVVSLYFGYNRAVNDYVIEFGLNLPGEAEGAGYVYPDGTQFHYTDITSVATLQAVRNSDEEFKGIDIETMVKSGHIHIGREVAAATNSGASGYSETTYKITARAKCFNDGAQARKFLTALANTPADYVTKMNIEYGVYLPMAKAADDYESEIGFLKNQLEVIQKGYEELIKNYGGNFVGNSEGKTLLAFSQEVKAYTELEILHTKARGGQNGGTPLLKDETANKQKYAVELAALQAELTKQQEILNALLAYRDGNGSGNTASTASKRAGAFAYAVADSEQTPIITPGEQIVLEQAQLVADLNERVKNIQNYIDRGVEDSEFATDVNEAYAKIEEFTKIYSDTCSTVYGKSASVVYLQPGIVVVTGGMNLIMIVLISLVIGIIIALIAAYIAGRYKLKAMNASIADGQAEAKAGETVDEVASDISADSKK